ncbi:MAG: hypothetical protein Q8N33_00700 [Rhodocyclaceae bacterium]|nr:hypothetical protein [Rhodocyclaceae bacterium]
MVMAACHRYVMQWPAAPARRSPPLPSSNPSCTPAPPAAIVAMKYFFKAVPKEWRDKIPEYVKDYVSLNQFM